MDISKLREGNRLLGKLEKLEIKREEYNQYKFRVFLATKYLDISEEEEQAVRKIFTDKLEAEIAEIERKIAEL